MCAPRTAGQQHISNVQCNCTQPYYKNRGIAVCSAHKRRWRGPTIVLSPITLLEGQCDMYNFFKQVWAYLVPDSIRSTMESICPHLLLKVVHITRTHMDRSVWCTKHEMWYPWRMLKIGIYLIVVQRCFLSSRFCFVFYRHATEFIACRTTYYGQSVRFKVGF